MLRAPCRRTLVADAAALPDAELRQALPGVTLHEFSYIRGFLV